MSRSSYDTVRLRKDHEENRSRDTLATRLDTQGPSSLCHRCSGIFLDPNTCRSLIEKGRQSPYRIEHCTVAELSKNANYGCALCSILSRAAQRDINESMRSFFDICPIPTTGLRSEIRWTSARNNIYGQPVHQLSFYYFAVPENPVATMIPSRTILSSVTNEKVTRRIERAFVQCLNQHNDCSRSKVNLLPTRVIDVEKMRLYNTSQKETGTYAALSYCWGGDQLFKTTNDNISSMMKGIALEDLPQTLQDAVKVCMQLKIQYLWIDALCIIQGDENDLSREISQMGLIYSRATVVISASRAKTVYDGFLADITDHSKDVIMLPARFSATCEGEIGMVQVPSGFSGDEPLNKRGWVFQESCLASRALIYTDGGIIWQCKELFDRLAFDGIQAGSHPSDDLPIFSEFKAGTLQRVEWDQLVRTYTLRRFKDPNDRLEALAGIATAVASLWNDRYYAGLWGHDLVSQLGWRLDESDLDYKGKWERLEAPSWSWASLDGPVCDIVRWDRLETPRGAQVMSCEVTLAHRENPFGRVLYGRLTIEAFLIKATNADSSWLGYTCMDFGSQPAEKSDYSKLWCLLLGCAPENSMGNDGIPQWYGLLLSRLHDGTFKRLGYFSQDLDSDYWSDDEVSFEEYVAILKDEQSLGIEARFPKGGQRRTVVII